MREFIGDSPALARLSWLLELVNGRDMTAAGARDVLSPDLVARIGEQALLGRIRDRARQVAPIRVVGIDVDTHSATARFRGRGEDMWVADVEVEAVTPHRITSVYTQRWVPDYLTPSLPGDFTASSMPAADGTALIVFGGVPGSGKSTVAERIGA